MCCLLCALLHAGGGGAFFVATLGLLARPANSEHTRTSATNIGLVFCALFLCVFAWRAKLAWYTHLCLTASRSTHSLCAAAGRSLRSVTWRGCSLRWAPALSLLSPTW